jgi:pantoate--beta-alanine ligase
VMPDVAVFGQKDAQQAKIIQRMVRDLNFPVDVVVCPTVREPDGLAMSSRNGYLSADERQKALCLNEALRLAERLCRDRIRDGVLIKAQMRGLVEKVLPEGSIDYIEVVDEETLEPVTAITRPALVAMAVRVGNTRLIDNALLIP